MIVKTGLLISVKCYLLNFKPSHVYLLPGLLFVSLFKPYCNKNKIIVGAWHCSGNQASHCNVLFDCSQQGPELKLLPTSASFTWSITLLMTQFLPRLCYICYSKRPDSLPPQPARILPWGDEWNSHTPWCWPAMSWRCGGNVPKFLNVFISLEHYLLRVQQPVGVRPCRPCIIHVCIVTTCRGTQHCTSFLLFNFEFLMLVWAQVFYRILWMYVNIQARTSLHPGNTQRLFWWFIVFNPKCVHNISVHIDILYIFPLFYPRCIYK